MDDTQRIEIIKNAMETTGKCIERSEIHRLLGNMNTALEFSNLANKIILSAMKIMFLELQYKE